MAFFQDPPVLGNQWNDDPVLESYVARLFPKGSQGLVRERLEAMGELAGRELYTLQLADRLNEPTLTQWDAWGQRVDEIEVSPLWKRAATVAAEHGLVATGYEEELGPFARSLQFLLVYLFDPSTDVYTCPLAMTDGAATTLRTHGGNVAERALPHLLSRDPDQMWTSGQWMTERTGGSDVGLSETRAEHDDGDRYRLFGTKWFTSASTSQMALTLARPTGNPPGGRGLALFYVELRDDSGRLNGIQVNRLKDKLGTRKVPTAELALDGTPATLVAGTDSGIRNIAPMLNVTRTWNAVCAVAGMRRGLALALDYAKRRVQFGAPLAEKPLHVDTLAGLHAEYEAAFHLTFRAVELLGEQETNQGRSPDGDALLRLLTPLVKLTTGRQAVTLASEFLECFGGAGYVEDTGIPRLLRDAQVLPIWEGTTNVLSLDALRAVAKDGSLAPLLAEISRAAALVSDPRLVPVAAAAREAARHAEAWLTDIFQHDPLSVEAGARRFALTLGRTLALALTAAHAQWELDNGRGDRGVLAARRFMTHGVDSILDVDRSDAAAVLAPD